MINSFFPLSRKHFTGPGISFHKLPSNSPLREARLKVIARKDCEPNVTLCHSVVCSKHFLAADYKSNCKNKKLKRAATQAPPMIIWSICSSVKKPRSNDPVRKREAAILCPVRIHSNKTVSSLSRRVNVNFPATGTSLQGVDTKENANDSSADAPDQVEQLFNATAVNTKNKATQVDVHSAVTIVEHQKWQRKERDLKTQIEPLKQTTIYCHI